MALAGRRPRWEDLGRDLLVSIFEKIEMEDLIAGVSFTCTAWRDAAGDPLCWRELDFRRWELISRRLRFRRALSVDFRDLLRFSIARAGGAVDSVFFPDFADEIDLLFVAERCPRLRYFHFGNDEEPTDQFLQAIDKLRHLQGMAVNEAVICEEVLEILTRCRATFTELEVFAERVSENMAAAICDALPNLRKLRLRDCKMSQPVLLLFLDELKDLESLDISGYSAPRITRQVLEKASRLKEFLWESELDLGDLYRCSGSCGDIFFQGSRD
ncbi:unnamed protein product [Spirodela intermedia]|uniref:F-box domain-containing protein n=1 Tax=Spirodela intermedia TaxID=51605 RepID=A0A7I8IKD3_SPIIN|nr:unnamed protein product [Spirodela intermedia]CAA6658348.1 unnamed protein product [Spirodela intermedia]